jgi:CRP-like cAMP-binding protein
LLSGSDDPILIRQGELLSKDKAYFYVLYRGECTFTVDNVVSTQTATPGDSFGELALLYDCPRAATVTALLLDRDAILS